MSKNKIEGDVRFALGQKKLKEGEHYSLEAKIGGGKKVAHVTFSDPNHMKEHRKHLETVAKNGDFTVELKAA